MKIIREILHNEGRPLMSALDIYRVVTHLPVGATCAYLITQGNSGNWGTALIGIVLTLVFLLYEIREHAQLNDKAYKDIMGFLIGMAIAGIILYLL